MQKLICVLIVGATFVGPAMARDDDEVARICCRVDQPDAVGGWASDHVLIRCQSGFIPRLPQDGGNGIMLPPPGRGRAEQPGAVGRFRAILAQWGVLDVTRTVEPADPVLAAQLGLDRYYTLWLAPGTDAQAMIQSLTTNMPLVEVAEVDGIGGLLDVPPANDPLLGLQYALRNFGQVVEGDGGTAGADARCIDGWAVSTGSGDIVLAILDTGVSYSHPDLQGKLVPGLNCTSQPPNSNVDDSWYISHGTACAGVAAASANNGIGIAGVSWGSLVMPIKVANVYGASTESQCGSGLIWAADHGAKVASISLGFIEGTSFFANAVTYAHLRDVVICASSGNTPGREVFYPARFPEVLAIGATNNRDELAFFSTTGPEVFLAAPGVNILTTWDTALLPDTYSMETGTSMSCPLVAGVACLIRAANPTLTADQVRFVLQLGADDLGDAGPDWSFGWGRVNTLRSLQIATNANRECRADWNNDGDVTSQDIFDFLTMYLQDRADFNRDGNTTSDDFFMFMSSFFTGC